MPGAFETALNSRVDMMLDACIQCGKCFEACPITGAAGIADATPRDVIAGVLDIVRTGAGPQIARTWASACVASGECIKACDYGVNPRFLLNMARVAMARHRSAPQEQRRGGVDGFRLVARDVAHLSKMQLTPAQLARLGQGPQAAPDATAEPPDVVFYTGCNVLKTPHIALLALDIMDALGVRCHVMGGPTHCCGIVQMRTGDIETSGRLAGSTLDKLARSKSGQVLAWCPSCLVQFNEVTLPTVERVRGARPFEMTPFVLFLRARLEELRPLMRHPVDMRVALHRHTGAAGVMEAAAEILSAVPGVTLVDLGQPAVGLMSNYLRALPAYERELNLNELKAARAAGVDALVAVYHADHRRLCAHERDWPFRILNALEIIGASMGLAHDDHYKRLKLKQDADAIVADCADLIAQHGLDLKTARAAVADMLDEQPLPLVGHAAPAQVAAAD
jgi:heterodisulfide reductase subunit D